MPFFLKSLLRPRFSLRTLFVVVTLICVWLGWNWRIVNERKACLARVTYEYIPGGGAAPFPRSLLGDWQTKGIRVTWGTTMEQLTRIRAAYPEATVEYLHSMPDWDHTWVRQNALVPSKVRE